MRNSEIILIGLIHLALISGNCSPDPDQPVQLGSPSNVTAPLGSDVQFICCSGLRWTYEASDASREIGPHPEAAGVPEQSQLEQSSGSNPQTTVYTMRDDKGRLILVINEATLMDAGHYRCHGYDGSKDAFLIVTPEKYVEGQVNPAAISRGSVIRNHVMFPSDNLKRVIINCPVTGTQVIQSWLWREPILPTSEEYSKLPPGQPPSRTVTTNVAGLHEGGHVEIGTDLRWARIVDPLSPEAPVKLWCQFEMPSAWKDKEPIVAYYVIDWELYDPIAPKIFLLNRTSDRSAAESPEAQADIIMQELDRIQEQPPKSLLVYEHKPATFACRFRIVKMPSAQKQIGSAQTVYWFRGSQPVHVPPFQVDNRFVATHGISLLIVRAYPAWLSMKSSDTGPESEPQDTISCVVKSQIKNDPVYKVTTNASLKADVILMPRIINESILSAEKNEHESVQLTCVAIGNGPPNMLFEMSAMQNGTTKHDAIEWIPIEPRYTLSVRQVQPTWNYPNKHKLILDISSLQRTDHRLYRCSVWNGAGRVHSIGQLLVRSPPKLEIYPAGSSYYVEHRPWTASCVVSGYPLDLQKPHDSPPGEDKSSTGNQTSPLRIKVLNQDGTVAEKSEIKPLSYEATQFAGINATFELRMSQREGQESIVRCEYTHTDGQLLSRDTFIRHATKPPAPEISVLCAGPKAVVFSVSNPVVTPESPPTDRIVTQKVMFASAKKFHNSGALDSLLVYLNAQGQPSAYPTNESLSNGHVTVQSHATVTQANTALTNTAVIPVTGLVEDTEYVFEWASGNEFGLSVMVQFMLWTKRLDVSPDIKHVIFLMPTDENLRFSIFLDDPCPYDGGARLELSDILVRYRTAKSSGRDKFVGYGEWSNPSVCDTGRNQVQADGTEDASGIRWAGNSPITCELKVGNTKENYEVQFATRNRFNRSEWFTDIYRPTRVARATSYCVPPCAATAFQQSILLNLLGIISFIYVCLNYH